VSRFTLEQVLAVAERQLEVETRKVKAAQGRILDARAHEARIAQAAVVERERLAYTLTHGATGAVLARHAEASGRIEAQRCAARIDVEEAVEAWQARLAEWKKLEGRVRAYKVIRERWLARLAIRERRQEQRVLDDWTNRNRLILRGGLK